MHSPYPEAAMLLSGKNIRKKGTDEIVPRLIFLSVLGYESNHDAIKVILSGRHHKYEAIDKPGWKDGKIVSHEEYDNYRHTCKFDYIRSTVYQ